MTHLDADQLAELQEGLLPAAQASDVRAHLRACAKCDELRNDLHTVRELLAQSPRPALPDSVAARIDSAIAAESARRGATGRVRSLEHARSRRLAWLPKALAAAAAVAVVALVGNSLIGDTGGSSGSATSQPAAAPEGGDRLGAGSPNGPAQMLAGGALRLDSETFGKELGAAVGQPNRADRMTGALHRRTRDAYGGCVRAAVGNPLPNRWYSRPARLDGRPVTLVLARLPGSGLHAWAVDCNGTPAVVASADVPVG